MEGNSPTLRIKAVYGGIKLKGGLGVRGDGDCIASLFLVFAP